MVILSLRLRQRLLCRVLDLSRSCIVSTRKDFESLISVAWWPLEFKEVLPCLRPIIG